jgi:hypothetical protein
MNQKLTFDIIDCTFISREQYNFLCFHYPKKNNIEYGFKLTKLGRRIFFIRDSFKLELEEEGML